MMLDYDIAVAEALLTDTYCSNNNGSFDFGKCGQYVDKIKPVLGPSLEGRVHWVLKEFICKQHSQYSKCFPWVKKWMETSAAWADCMDAFLTKDTPVGEEMIKYAINYVAKGGLVTQFVDSRGSNNKANKTRQELDSFPQDQSIVKSMNVWRYINEKDYWLRTCANTASVNVIFETSPRNSHLKDTCNSDLEVEVGSCSKKTCERHRGFPRNQQNRLHNSKSSSRENMSDCSCNIDDNMKRKHKKNSLNTIPQNRDYTVRRKQSKLKTFIYQNRNVNDSTMSPIKVTNISIPCRPSQLIVRIFEADPSLSDSCLILMKRKFENGIRNVCSCLNEILKKLASTEVKDLRLVCEIRPGYIDLNLRRPRTSKPRLFLARLPTCRSHPKREPRCKHTNSCEDSSSRCGEFQYHRNSVSVDCCTNGSEKHEKFDKGARSFVFRTPRSNYSSTNEKDCTSSQDEEINARIKRKVFSKEANLVWTRKPEKEVSFKLIDARKVEESSTDDNSEICRLDVTCCGNVNSLSFDKKEDRESEDNCIEQPTETMIKQETRSNESTAGKIENNAESSDSNSSRYSDSLKEDERKIPRENCSNTGICNPQQCLCHVLNTKNNANTEETVERLNYPKPQSIGGKDPEKSSVESYCSQKGPSRTKESVSQVLNAAVKAESSVQRNEDGVIRTEESNLPIKQSISEPKKRDTVAERSAEVAEKYSADSICSLNSNYTEASCGTKCSCCGEDLTDAERIEIESENFTISIESKVTAAKEPSNGAVANNRKSIESLKAKAKGAKENKIFFAQGPFSNTSPLNDFAGQRSKYKTMDGKNVAKTSSIEDRPTRVVETRNPSIARSSNCNAMPDSNNIGRGLPTVSNGPSNISRACAEICENGRSLAAGRTSTEQFSCRSNVSTNLYSPEDGLRVRRRERRMRPGSLYCRSSARTRLRGKSMRSTIRAPSYSTQDLREIDCARESRRDVKVRNYTRCSRRNRFRSAASGYLCGSFPAASIDRLKYLIRRKLRRLLLEQRDRGTSTSKTFLRSERYFVSISSGKLSEGHVIRNTCSVDRLNRYVAKEQDGETRKKKKTRSNVWGSKKDTLERVVKKRDIRSMFRGDLFEKFRIAKVSKVLSPKRVTKLMDTYNLTGRRENGGRRNLETKSVGTAYSSTNMFFAEDSSFQRLRNPNKKHLAEEYSYLDKVFREKRQNLRSKRDLKKCRENCCKCGSSTDTYDEIKNEKLPYNNSFRRTENALNLNDLKLLRRHFQSRADHDEDFAIFCRDYEKYVNYIYVDFKLRLLQYVALCRHVKNTLIKRLRSDDVPEVRSSTT
ncbi:uncharacterized protein LOC116432930 [Nomia melanderi]|uniref:uncharacterized protein LOC116432930 n=1 Tax=Nomia melanderi TaxID=2448451 RepID=UPI003FCDA69C